LKKWSCVPVARVKDGPKRSVDVIGSWHLSFHFDVVLNCYDEYKENYMTTQQTLKEVREAITAANRALDSLESAQRELKGAKNWGLRDLVGGGMMTTMFKHGRMDKAQRQIEDAKYYLQVLKKELRDIDVPMNFNIEVGGFLSFADLFFDGAVADWMVQSRINDAIRQVNNANARVMEILGNLQRWEDELLAGPMK